MSTKRLLAWDPAHWASAADWATLLDPFWRSVAGLGLARSLQHDLGKAAVIYPAQPLRALELTALAQVRVVIAGQDPYHGAGQASGLAFAVPPGVPPPPSLRNIQNEVRRDLCAQAASAGATWALEAWARQGVLLLNTCLTVEHGLPGSHAGRGWEVLTDQIIAAVAAKPDPVVFLLWGRHAQRKRALIEAPACGPAPAASRHLILCANHPSPLSARRGPVPFVGCGHFSRANAFLHQNGAQPIDWLAG